VAGVKSAEAGYGISPLTSQYYAGFVKYFGNKWYWKANLYYLSGKDDGIKFTSIGADFAPSYTLVTIGEGIYLNLRGGLTMSMDKLNPAIVVYDAAGNANKEDYSTLKFGVFGGFESEIFINDKFVFVVGANQRYMFKSEFGNNRYFATAGIRYNF